MKLKVFVSDSVLSIAGLMLMNIVAQFLIYPVWNRQLGNEAYGNILYVLSLMNIVAISVGSGANYAFITESAGKRIRNSGYNCFMILVTILAIPMGIAIGLFANIKMTVPEIILFIILMIATMWRFFADVEYRLNLNYKGYFIYYFSISVGYLIGAVCFHYTGLWPLALLPGEFLGLFIVWKNGHILRWEGKPSRDEFISAARMIMALLVTNVIGNLIFNADRLLLKYLISGAAVSIYYQASLLGKTVSLVSTPLNSVIVGYLSQYKRPLTTKMMHLVVGIAISISVFGTIMCTLASHILIPILYPQNYEQVKEFFLLANLAQVLYFVTGAITVVLLRYGNVKYQVYVNVVYAAAFCLLCIPFTMRNGIWGFCWAMLATCLLRMCFAILLGYKSVKKI